MSRSVHCLLVATDAAASHDAVTQMETFVERRFGTAPITLKDERATEPAVMRELENAAKACRAGGLFLLMFSGHGGFDKQAHFWQLASGQLPDGALLRQVSHFHPEVEVFIVSDCCYGAGMLRPGVAKSVTPPGGSAERRLSEEDKLVLQGQLEQWLRAFTGRAAAARLSEQRTAGDKSISITARGNVVLAAATDWLMVRTNLQNRFVRALCGAVPEVAKYKELRAKMISILPPDGQSNWIVDAEPASALELPPLLP